MEFELRMARTTFEALRAEQRANDSIVSTLVGGPTRELSVAIQRGESQIATLQLDPETAESIGTDFIWRGNLPQGRTPSR
jgi:hypothetical protein